MALVITNSLVDGFSGMFGKLVFKQLRGKTIVAHKPSKPKSQSSLQRDNRLKFRRAAAYAKAMMLDPEKKAYYWKKAKKLKLPNAYTAAITDYMRKIKISDVNTQKYAGAAGGRITLQAGKNNFEVAQVKVTLVSKNGETIEGGQAVNTMGVWVFKTTVAVTDIAGVMVITEARDYAGQIAQHTHII